MAVLLLLRGRENQARVRRRVLRLEVADRLEVARVGDDFGEALQLLELAQFRAGLLLVDRDRAHSASKR